MKVGFICEGKTEKKIVASDNFQNFLKSIHIECVENVIDAKGNGNLLPKFLPAFVNTLSDAGAEKICIITDLDMDACITITKDRIDTPRNYITVVSVKQIEAWFLADSACMSIILGQENFRFESPENEDDPFERIKQLLIQYTSRGVSDKILLAAKMLNNNFSVLNAAAHPNCNSAKYLVAKLKSLSEAK